MPRKISGSTNDASKVLILNESDWSVENTENVTTGNFEVGGLDSGKKMIIGHRNTDGEIVGYGNVDTIYSDLYGRDIEKALRFNDDDNPYLSKTLGSPTSDQKGILSFWLKRGNTTDSYDGALMGQYVNINNQFQFGIESTSHVTFWQGDAGASTIHLVSHGSYRDTTGWYNLVVAVDTTQALLDDRIRMWINNEALTFSTHICNQNTSLRIFQNGLVQYLFRYAYGSTPNWVSYDGYAAETIYLDGATHADPPSLFGQDSHGIWVPKTSLTGLTYGNNGFKLTFSNDSGLGDDTSGNYNNYTATNLTALAQVTDTPTNNFAIFNVLTDEFPLVAAEGNLKITRGSSPTYDVQGATSTLSFDVEDSDGYYAEFKMTDAQGGLAEIGIADVAVTDLHGSDAALGNYTGQGDNCYIYRNDNGNKYHAASNAAYGNTYTNGDIIGVLVKNGKLYFSKNGTWQNSGDPDAETGFAYDSLSGRFVFCCSIRPINSDMEVNFGNPTFATTSGYTDTNGYGDFEYQPPTGSKALCSANLPDPSGAIDESTNGVYVNSRTGTGATANITDVNFDVSAGALVVVKSRGNAQSWMVYDTVRGPLKRLNFDSTAAELSVADTLTSFNSNGYTLGSDNAVNQNTIDFLDVVLREGPAYGLDIVTYTGNATARNISHDLGRVPTMWWIKNRTDVVGTIVYHTYMHTTAPEDYYMWINSNGSSIMNTAVWDSTQPTSTQFRVGTGNAFNGNGDDIVAYLFADIPGYCKAFRYIGNGLADGPYIPLGFRPAFYLIKRVPAAEGWFFDSGLSAYNSNTKAFNLDSSAAESDQSNQYVDRLAQGFKIRGNSAVYNDNGDLYIGFAWAEQPGKWSNAR